MAAVPLWYMVTPGLPGPAPAVAAAVPLSLLAAVPLAGVFVTLQRGRQIRPSGRPVFSWCTYAGNLCWMAVVVLNVWTWDLQPNMFASTVLAGAGFHFWLERKRRYQRLSRGVQ
jgi:hypothetical protein